MYEPRDAQPLSSRRFAFAMYFAGVLLAPGFHRVLHRFHWDAKERS